MVKKVKIALFYDEELFQMESLVLLTHSRTQVSLFESSPFVALILIRRTFEEQQEFEEIILGRVYFSKETYLQVFFNGVESQSDHVR